MHAVASKDGVETLIFINSGGSYVLSAVESMREGICKRLPVLDAISY